MLNYPAELKESIDPELVIKNLKVDYPWISEWSIHVSIGLTNVVRAFFDEIESIMGTNNPAFVFFRISEEVNNTYQRQLHIFFQARRSINVKYKALFYWVSFKQTTDLFHSFLSSDKA